MASSSSQVIKGVYYPSWVSTSVPPSSINTKLFTHIFYAFITPNNETFEFNTTDQLQKQSILNFTSTLRAMNPPVKTLFSIGGAAQGTHLFTRMASNQDSRRRFILSSMQLARELKFDGIDLDWEFPETPQDMQNLGYLFDEWRVEVDNETRRTSRPPLLLAAAVYYSTELSFSGPRRSYPSNSIKKNLDWINIMTYDYHGSWNTAFTGAHAALFDPRGNLSTSFGLRSWIQSGVPKNKLIMGLPLYGKTWKLRDPRLHSIGAPAVGVGPGYNGSGTMTYSEVINYNRNHNANVEYDSETVSHYSVEGTNWIGYDDTKSVAEKINYARALEIRGYFFWAVHGDNNWIISKTASNLWST